MRKIFLITFFMFYSVSAFATCDFKEANQILDLIRTSHPELLVNKNKGFTLEKSIDVAKQRPNPTFNGQTSFGDTDEGLINKTEVSLLHTFELGSKRNSRINLAKTGIQVGVDLARYENENTLIDAILKMYRLRQIHELMPVYEESLGAFEKILKQKKRRKSLSPEHRVDKETLDLATNDYKLKISRLLSEKLDLNKHLSFFMGLNCEIPPEALPSRVMLDEEFNPSSSSNYSKLKAAQSRLDSSKAQLQLEDSRRIPNLKVGPYYEFDGLAGRDVHSFGLALSMDLPLLNTNQGSRAKSAMGVSTASAQLENIQKESQLDLESYINQYNQLRNALKTIANKEDLEEKHHRIERLFKRGIISTALVIESHRQLIEFTNTRFDFELGAVNSLWRIYQIKGVISEKKL